MFKEVCPNATSFGSRFTHKSSWNNLVIDCRYKIYSFFNRSKCRTHGLGIAWLVSDGVLFGQDRSKTKVIEVLFLINETKTLSWCPQLSNSVRSRLFNSSWSRITKYISSLCLAQVVTNKFPDGNFATPARGFCLCFAKQKYRCAQHKIGN